MREELTLVHRCRMCGAEDGGAVIWREKDADPGRRSQYERDYAAWHHCEAGTVGVWELVGARREKGVEV
jgi:hypothetical protein